VDAGDLYAYLQSSIRHIIRHMRMHPSCSVLQRPATSCNVLQRPATSCNVLQGHQLPLSADPHGILHFPQIRFAGQLHEEGQSSAQWTSFQQSLNLDQDCHHQMIKLDVACCASLWVVWSAIPTCQSLIRTTLRHIDRLCRQCTRFSEPACWQIAAVQYVCHLLSSQGIGTAIF